MLVTTSEVMVEVGDKKDRQAGLWTYDGLVFTEVGGDFLANAAIRSPTWATMGAT